MNLDSLRPGGYLSVLTAQGPTALKIAGLFVVEECDQVYALVRRGSITSPIEGDVVDPRRDIIGHAHSIESVLPSGAQFDHLFALATFTPEVSAALLKLSKPAAVSRDIAQNVFGPGMMRVKHLPGDGLRDAIGRRNAARSDLPSVNGILTGDITNPVVVTQGQEIVLNRAVLARGRGHSAFAGAGDGGRPVLSSSNALLGFIMGRDRSRTLLLAAEDVVNEMGIRFLTRPSRPGVRQQTIRPRRAA
jgi:hypothetical protein